ncbi:uncharacterized protein LOC127281050 [Leptopilina boulardi]|uniref:uncharacterized protein LOC127281050 n=1 Tax=Leptopilina boulardi TaxID=63433 RepID=UPI0021F5DEB1|nr:uncharacterized protein LOC127281050 [Leptopilina boulardi]
MDKAERVIEDPSSATLPKIPVLRIQLTSERSSDAIITSESSDLVAVNRADFEALLSERSHLMEKLAATRKELSILEEDTRPSATPTSRFEADLGDQYKALLDLLKERHDLSAQIAKITEESDDLRANCARMKKDLKSYEEDYHHLSEDYSYQEDYSNRLRELFHRTVSEVYHAHANLREPKLRPKVPEGCLNCGIPGHSFRSCHKKYSGKFCQVCAHPDFTTKECPWPHYPNAFTSIPENRRCKSCWQPKNLPNPHCVDCRRRMIAEGIIKRNKLAQELENSAPKQQSIDEPNSRDQASTSAPRSAAASQTGEVHVSSIAINNSRSDISIQSLPSTSKARAPRSNQETEPVDSTAPSKFEPPLDQETAAKLAALPISGHSRIAQNFISPRESEEDNITLWANLKDALGIGLDKDDEKEPNSFPFTR